nr:hypothetical protein Q903MT_gene1526 [Picea sitchensis]
MKNRFSLTSLTNSHEPFTLGSSGLRCSTLIPPTYLLIQGTILIKNSLPMF